MFSHGLSGVLGALFAWHRMQVKMGTRRSASGVFNGNDLGDCES